MSICGAIGSVDITNPFTIRGGARSLTRLSIVIA